MKKARRRSRRARRRPTAPPMPPSPRDDELLDLAVEAMMLTTSPPPSFIMARLEGVTLIDEPSSRMVRKQAPGGMVRRAARAFEVKLASANGQGLRTIEGYISTFEGPENHDSHGDIMHPRAFDEVVEAFERGERKVRILDHHGVVVGSWDELRVDDRGLWAKGHISPTTAGRDLATLIDNKDVEGLSIGFPYRGSEYRMTEEDNRWGDGKVREWTKVNLVEASPVWLPSNHEANVTGFKSGRQGGRIAQKGSAVRRALLRGLIELDDEGLPDVWNFAWAVAQAVGLRTDTIRDMLDGRIDPRPGDLRAMAMAAGLDLAVLEAALAEDQGAAPVADDAGDGADESGGDAAENSLGAALGGAIVEAVKSGGLTAGDIYEGLAFVADLTAADVEAVVEGRRAATFEQCEAFEADLGLKTATLTRYVDKDRAAKAEAGSDADDADLAQLAESMRLSNGRMMRAFDSLRFLLT